VTSHDPAVANVTIGDASVEFVAPPPKSHAYVSAAPAGSPLTAAWNVTDEPAATDWLDAVTVTCRSVPSNTSNVKPDGKPSCT
jgi:hypothetical protein